MEIMLDVYIKLYNIRPLQCAGYANVFLEEKGSCVQIPYIRKSFVRNGVFPEDHMFEKKYYNLNVWFLYRRPMMILP